MNIACDRCKGKVFLDRTFAENRNFETFCIMCGDRKFISKESSLGLWLKRMESQREGALSRASSSSAVNSTKD